LQDTNVQTTTYSFHIIDLYEFAHAKDSMVDPVNIWRSHLHTTFSI